MVRPEQENRFRCKKSMASLKDEANIVAKELPDLIKLLSDFDSKSNSFKVNLKALSKRLKNGDFSGEKGISFLDVKNNLLLQYLIDVCFVMLLKLNSQSIEKNPCLERIVEVRTYLEKIRPIDQKLKYQIDKLTKMATEGAAVASNNPLSFRPKLDNMDDVDNENDEDIKNESTNAYVVPKALAVPYDDNSITSKRQKVLERAKQRALDSSLIKELQSEYSEQPEEYSEFTRDKKALKRKEKEDAITKYEEDNFLRMPVTKKDKQERKRKNYERFDDITKFDNINALHQDVENDLDDIDKKNKKKKGKFDRKKSGFKKKKMNKFKRRK